MTSKIERGKLGQSFGEFLKEQGVSETTTEQAAKRVIAFQLAQIMKEKNISKSEMARRLETSRSQIDRLLDPDQDAVTIGTLSRAANAVGRRLSLELT